MTRTQSLCALIAVLSLTVALPAQTLTINGATTHANLPIHPSKSHTLTLTGPGGVPHHWIADSNPGPTVVMGTSLPVGITANTINIGLGTPFPMSGTRSLTFGPQDPSLIGQTWYSVAVFLDTNGPIVSNGISLTFVAGGAEAGPDAATFVGQEVTLDGSGNGPGSGAAWSIVGSPAGSNPQLTNTNGDFPVFSTDMPGTYAVEVQTSVVAGMSADQAIIEVFDVQFSNVADGAFVGGAVNLDGTVDGPPVASVEINGTPVALAGNAFSGGTLTPTDVMNPITARLTTSSGQVIERTVTAIHGASAPMTSIGMPGTALRLNGTTLDALEPPVELALAAVPLNQLFTAIPTIPIVPSGLFTADLTFTGASFDPNTVDFDIYPANCAIGLAVTLNQLAITADITGTTFGFPYSETATITADSVIISGEMLIGSNASGGIEITMQNQDANLVNFNLQVTGLLGGFFNLLEPLVEAALEAAFQGVLDIIPLTLNPLLSGLVVSADLSGVGVPLQVDLPINSVCYDMNGLTLANDFRATRTTTSPTAPVLTDYLTTPGGVPAFGANTAVNGVPYDFAAGIDDELMNQTLAALTTAGGLDLDLTTVGMTFLDAGAMALLVPGAGFESLPQGTPVTLEVRNTTAPAIVFSSTGTMAALHLGNQRLVFKAETAPGEFSPILEVGVTSQAGLSISIDPVTGTLSITPGTVTTAATVGGSLAGTDASATVSGISTLVSQLIPLITQPLSAIPLPFTALTGGGIVEVSVPGSTTMLTTWVDIP